MMRGVVTENQGALLLLQVSGPGGELEVEAVLDTGFSGFLLLRPDQIAALRLPHTNAVVTALAEGTNVIVNEYQATVLWHGQERLVWVLEAEGEPLAGMALLDGHRVCMDVVDGGAVTIELLPSV